MRTVLLSVLAARLAAAAGLGAAIVGTTTSYFPALTASLDDLAQLDHVPCAFVFDVWKEGGRNLNTSRSKVGTFAEEMHTKRDLTLVPDIATPSGKVAVILQGSLVGRIRPGQAKAHRQAAGRFVGSCQRDGPAHTGGERPGLPHVTLPFWGDRQGSESTRWDGSHRLKPGSIEHPYPLEVACYEIRAIELLHTLVRTSCEAVSHAAMLVSDEIAVRWKGRRRDRLSIEAASAEWPENETLLRSAAAAHWEVLSERRPGGRHGWDFNDHGVH